MTGNCCGIGTGTGSGLDCEVILREAGLLDARVIAELHRQCFFDGLGGRVWGVASIVKVLSLFGSYAYLTTVAPKSDMHADSADPLPTGFLLARNLPGESEILTLGVVTAWRRQGTARTLLRAALTRASQAGAARTLLEVAEDNTPARSLYGAEGFALVRRWPRYYSRPGGSDAAALVFARDLA